MFALVLLIAGIILLVLAGVNVGGPRFNPAWLGWACVVAAYFAPMLAAHR